MYLDSAGIDFPIRVQINMEMIARQAPVNQFHAADFDNLMAFPGIDAGGFGIEHHLADLTRHLTHLYTYPQKAFSNSLCT